METKIIWQQDTSNPENANNLAKIGQWWASLKDKEIVWKQRLIPSNGKLDEINWEQQRFDEKFSLKEPQLRGITIYWQKPDSERELNITVKKLELDLAKQQIYIYPQLQPQVVIRVSKPEIIYQTIELTNPQVAATNVGDNYLLLLRDPQQQLQIKVILSHGSWTKLVEDLSQ
ncbi:hypothetical protein IQ238_08440 [Pleurocapsales cyanobacterium LEGE 06147]|nr:hypothetical protein [Pleurocapsales cyanobacterium LEGE 06147]